MAKKSAPEKSAETTPMMVQYLAIKNKYRDMILLYRMGDFYETFYEDAQVISRVLGITLTKRAHGKTADVPLAGFPYHALDNYLPRLVQAGHRVAICEQVEDPKKAKTVVKREVTEIVTPGTALSEKLLRSNASHFLAAIILKGSRVGVGFCDFSTGEFNLCEIELANLIHYLQEVQPREILLPAGMFDSLKSSLDRKISAVLTRLDDWIFSHQYGYETLTGHFKTSNLKGFGAEEYPLGITAAGAVLHYGKYNFQNELPHIHRLAVISAGDHMILDNATRRNLEILNPIMGQDEEGTLLAVLDKTVTPMGGRLIRQLITHPLVRLEPVKQRLDRVEAFFSDNHRREEVRDQLGEISDLERLLGRISTGRASPRDLNSLRRALAGIAPLRETLGAWDVPALRDYRDNLRDMDQVVALIEQAIDENPPLNLTEGGIIREGYHPPLDELRQISREGKDWMLNLQSEEREKSNIPSLKIGYNKVFGYYFEVTRAHSAKVPDYFIRKQTLVNAERYITPALKEYEEKVLGAEEKMGEMEYQLFQEIRDTVAGHGKDIQNNARLIAELDCWAALAEAAVMYKYARPEVDEGEEIVIEGGRHPVVERLLPPDESFIENDTALGNRDTQIMLITGPNMSGKSTYLRQVGLIVLLAQIGSFVPAERARIGLTDRIYTRVGASDNLAFGESTFMVEMLEAANILNNATPQSLILLDEVGRGTSTYDGLSIAWAMTEYLHHHKRVAAKTLFATHYHELTRLEGMHPRVKNYRVAVREYEDHVVFLRKIERGGMDNSYGIYVAQMAGLPAAVIERAREVLRSLEGEEAAGARKGDLRGISGMTGKEQQLSLFEPPRPSVVEGELRKLDPDHLTPIEALLKLQELKKMLE